VLEPVDANLLNRSDVVFLALPHGASGEISAQLTNPLIVDIGADHRLERLEDWDEYYGGAFYEPYVYGLPELPSQREVLKQARRIAVPGCNVTAVTLALMPAVAQGLVSLQDITAVLANGYSGAGKSLKVRYLLSEGANSASPYAVGGVHRHIPEMRQNLAKIAGLGKENYDTVSISFTPVLVPMTRGILATCTAKIITDTQSAQNVQEVYEQYYQGERFINILPPNLDVSTANVYGSNYADIQLAVDQKVNRLVAICAIDNLVRGTAGQAIQSMNIALGLEEHTGITELGIIR
jgi:N-acetyl-gamma-glutamyl-phosphate reductase